MLLHIEQLLYTWFILNGFYAIEKDYNVPLVTPPYYLPYILSYGICQY